MARAFVTASSQWLAASYNTARAEPFKSTASAAQKAALLAYVALARFGG